ncbi:hypothetical protein NKH71_31500, partial [Mesorhizobium sp. M0983]|uniref:F-box protein n=1 Tax=Mesorhizobium sp. M0983 TaxID=2957040 RepID=UPI00333661C1
MRVSAKRGPFKRSFKWPVICWVISDEDHPAHPACAGHKRKVREIMRDFDVRGKAPMPIALEADITNDSPAEPVLEVEGPGQSSTSVVEQTHFEPQAPSGASSSRRRQHTSSLLSLPQDALSNIADRLRPIDVLSLALSSRELQTAVQQTPLAEIRRGIARRVQAIWNRLIRYDVDNPFAALMYPGVTESLAPNFDCLTRAQQGRLVAFIEGQLGPERNSVL